jgi:hypothetical protein
MCHKLFLSKNLLISFSTKIANSNQHASLGFFNKSNHSLNICFHLIVAFSFNLIASFLDILFSDIFLSIILLKDLIKSVSHNFSISTDFDNERIFSYFCELFSSSNGQVPLNFLLNFIISFNGTVSISFFVGSVFNLGIVFIGSFIISLKLIIFSIISSIHAFFNKF